MASPVLLLAKQARALEARRELLELKQHAFHDIAAWIRGLGEEAETNIRSTPRP